MQPTRLHRFHGTLRGLAALTVVSLATPVIAQADRPGPAPASRTPNAQPISQDADPPNGNGDGPTRRVAPEGKSKLAFDDQPIDSEVFSFIAEMTGKVVMPMNLVTIETKKFTLVNDEFIPNAEALDLLFQAFRLNDIGIIEKEDVIIIGSIDQIIETRQLPVINADEDISQRRDRGSLVMKLFRLNEVRVEDVSEQLAEGLPGYARLTPDANSNQIIVVADIALCQHLDQVIKQLDNNYLKAKTRTYRLAYADATAVADNINELFESTGSSSGNAAARRTTRGGGRNPQNPTAAVVGPEIELRVTVSTQQNSITVVADPKRMEQISDLIVNEWDLPRSPGTSKIYTLRYTDPLKVADLLNNLLNQGAGGGGAARAGRTGGAGGGGTVDDQLQGIYKIEPSPESSQIMVLCKTEQSLDFLDDIVARIDQPSSIGLPFVVELKHADAIELAEELNALLAEAGAGADIGRPASGLSGREEGAGGTAGTEGDSGDRLSFPWQRGGRQRDDVSPESSLIGKIRIVPIVRRNALAILCPLPQTDAVRMLIENFDKPGRQVMISALIAEVELNDNFAFGVRFSSSDDIISGGNRDFLVSGVSSQTGSITDALGDFFDTSMLDVGFDVNIVLQALSQKTNVRILQQPVIFTADNQEALFFDGQDIPFITNSTINTQGNPTDSFEYREVGVIFNVRPRITVNRDVDLEILLELSSVVPGVTLFGGAIVDRRETTTHVVLRNEQTVVISGIIREEETKIERSIPLLGDIPIVGELFKSRDNTLVRSELLAFITPYVVDNLEENETNIQSQYRDRLSEMSRPVDEQIDIMKRDPDSFRRRIVPDDVPNVADTPGRPGEDILDR